MPVVHLRTGIVLSGKGGALAKQLPLFRFGLGGKLGSGRQWQSWIALDDEVAAIDHLLTAGVTGTGEPHGAEPCHQRRADRVARRRAAPPAPA